jgi:hypothetical protein
MTVQKSVGNGDALRSSGLELLKQLPQTLCRIGRRRDSETFGELL